jgi:hypothetical protein
MWEAITQGAVRQTPPVTWRSRPFMRWAPLAAAATLLLAIGYGAGRIGTPTDARDAAVADASPPLVTDATTVRLREGKTLITDGPFAETHEQLGGFFLVDCQDLDEAISWAGKIPHAAYGSVEIRPLWSEY